MGAALTESLRNGKPVAAKLTLDEGTIEEQFLLVNILNFSAVGPRLPLAWSADPSDGLLEIGYSLADRYNEFCAWLSDGASPWAEAPVTLLRSRNVTVEWEHARFRIGDNYWPMTGSPEPPRPPPRQDPPALDGPLLAHSARPTGSSRFGTNPSQRCLTKTSI